MADNRFSGKQRFQRRMLAIPASVKAAAHASLGSSAKEMKELIQGAAPRDDGDLIDSVEFQDISTADRIAWQVTEGNDEIFYPRFQEFGTPTHAAQPHFFPTYRANRKRVANRVARAIGKAARQAVRR